MRYARVELILDQEAAFKARMGPKTEVVLKPDGEKQLFSPEVIAVTQAIHDTGKDAHKVQKTEIIRAAVKVFEIGKQPSAINGQPQPQPQPEPTVAPNTAPVAPAAEDRPAQKPAPKPPAKPKAPAEETKPLSKKDEAVPEPAPSAQVDSGRELALQKARETLNNERPGENPAAYNAYISMYSLALSLLQLIELYDNQPGKEKRLKTMDDLAREVFKHTTIKSAKESQKA